MPVFIVILKDHSIRILSQPPRSYARESGSHCFLTNSDFTISTLMNFLAPMINYIDSGTWNHVTIEGFALVY